MASNNTFQIASHFTNVDLAQGLTTNLSEIELALKLNPGEFTNLTLLDQAKGSTFKNTAFPTAWDGSKDYFSDGFGQDIWRTTGLGFLQPSNLSQSLSQTTLNFAKIAHGMIKSDTFSQNLQHLIQLFLHHVLQV